MSRIAWMSCIGWHVLDVLHSMCCIVCDDVLHWMYCMACIALHVLHLTMLDVLHTTMYCILLHMAMYCTPCSAFDDVLHSM